MTYRETQYAVSDCEAKCPFCGRQVHTYESMVEGKRVLFGHRVWSPVPTSDPPWCPGGGQRV